ASLIAIRVAKAANPGFSVTRFSASARKRPRKPRIVPIDAKNTAIGLSHAKAVTKNPLAPFGEFQSLNIPESTNGRNSTNATTRMAPDTKPKHRAPKPTSELLRPPQRSERHNAHTARRITKAKSAFSVSPN